MYPRVESAKPLPEYKLLLKFTNGEEGIFDVSPYLNKGVFRALQNTSVFQAVKMHDGTVVRPGDLDFCPDTLYERIKQV